MLFDVEYGAGGVRQWWLEVVNDFWFGCVVSHVSQRSARIIVGFG